MVSNLPVLRPPGEAVRVSREAGRQLARIEDSAVVQARAIEAVKYVVFHGLYAVADLGELESRLIARTPLAERRLRFVGDSAAAKITQLIDGMQL